MPGLIGFVKKDKLAQPDDYLRKMAQALESDPRYRLDLYQGDEVGLGRVGLDFLQPEAQPIWNEDNSLCLFMEGEIYDYAGWKPWLLERGHRFKSDSVAELVLHLYEELGEEFAVKLNGAFIIAIWDRQAQKLLLANDRLGLFPLYYAQVNGGLIFGSGVRALLAEPALPRTVDPVTVNQFLVFDHALDDRTLLSNVRRLPPASLLKFYHNQLNIHPYWVLTYPTLYQKQDEAVYFEQLKHYLGQAVTRQKPNNQSAGVLLSGGLDSRILLALLLDDGLAAGTFHTFTWGIPGCDDARFAREVAAKVGTQHHFFELKPDWLLDLAVDAVRLTDGLGNIINLHALATLAEEAQHAQIIYKGFMGDAMFGYALKRQMWADYDDQTRYQVHLGVHNEHGVINYDQAEQKKLFTEEFQNQVGCAVYQAYQEGMDRSGVKQLANQRLYFDLTQRVPRHTLNGVEVARSRMIVRLPFCDNDLLDFTLTVPPGFHFERYLIKTVFGQTYPKLAQIPFTEANLPLISCAREIRLRAGHLLRWHLGRAGFGWMLGQEGRPYKDYTNWFRTVLRPWLEDTLLSNRALGRGYFKPDYVRQLVAAHLAGENHTVRLGALLTLELWHRQFID